MAKPKYTLYKYVKLSRGKWRYCRAARYKNHMIKPNTVMVGEKEEVPWRLGASSKARTQCYSRP